MTDVFANPTVRLALAVPVLLILIALGFWLMGRLRDYTTDDRHEPLGALVNLEEMLRNGDISEEEFRTIKASARSRLASSSTKRSETES